MLPKHYGRKVFLGFLYLFYQIQKAAGKWFFSIYIHFCLLLRIYTEKNLWTFTYFFICTPLNIHSYIFSFKCYTIIRVVAIFPQSWLPAAGLRKIQQITRHDPAYFYELTAPA